MVWADVQLFLWAGGPYRLGSMVVHAALGILLARWWLTGSQRHRFAPLVVGVAALTAAAAMLAAEQMGRLDLVPYSGTFAETLLCALLVVGALGTGIALARALPRWVVVPVAIAGAMTFTLYALQVLWLGFDVRVLHPGQRDDSWVNLGVLVLGSLVAAAAWRSAVRRGPWHRGPLEGATSLLAGRSRSADSII